MQFSRVTLLAILAAVVSADSIPEEITSIPSCAVSCLDNALTKSSCGITDYYCQCTSGHNTILANSASCISSSCSVDDTLQTTDVTSKICALAIAASSSSSSSSSTATGSTGSTTPRTTASNTTSAAAATSTKNAGRSLRAGVAVVGAAALAAALAI